VVRSGGEWKQVALTGTFNRNLDNKYRLAIPRRLREDFSEKDLNHLFVAPGPNNSLALYSQEGFERLAEILSDRSPNRANNRNYLRLFYSQAEKVEFDKQGRIRIPERLVQFAGLKKDVVLLGIHDHAELWDADQWNAFLETNGPEFDQMSGQAFQ